MISFKVLKANCGDCFLIKFKGSDERIHNIIIDLGISKNDFKFIKDELEAIKKDGETLDCIIFTHSDNDHMRGLKHFVKSSEYLIMVHEYWLNEGFYGLDFSHDTEKISFETGISFYDFLLEKNCNIVYRIHSNMSIKEIFGLKVTVINPSVDELNDYIKNYNKREATYRETKIIANPDWKSDIETLVQKKFKAETDEENDISLSFIFEYKGIKLLYISDTPPSKIADYLVKNGYSAENRLNVNFCKISHHGSKHSTNQELLALIKCNNFIISANASLLYCHPTKEALSRIIKRSGNNVEETTFYFNYGNDTLRSIFTEDEKEKYNIKCIYTEESENGICINI